MLKLLSKHDQMDHMIILCNKNDEKEMIVLVAFETAHNGKNGFSACNDSTNLAIHADNKVCSK